MNEENRTPEPVAPIIDDAEKGTLTCPKCGEKGQRANRHCCMNCGHPFSEERQCPVCGSLLSAAGLCEPCGKTYRRAEHDREKEIENMYEKLSNKEAKPCKWEEYLNILPAKIPMIISIALSVIVLVLFFMPTIRFSHGWYPYSTACGVLDLIPKNTGLFDTVSPKVGRLIGAAYMGMFAALIMPALNLLFFVKNNPMMRGIIMFENLVLPPFVVWSIFVARDKLNPFLMSLPRTINAIGILCICCCVAVAILGIVSFILLKDNCEEVKRGIPSDKEKKYKTYSRKKILTEMGIRV